MRRSFAAQARTLRRETVMNQKVSTRSRRLALALAWLAVLPAAASATIVEFRTNMGDFQVNLYDMDTPQTVANFLGYVINGDYDLTIIHRSVPGFVVQGGGFSPLLDRILVGAPSVINEPVFSNVRASIAMAKIAGDPNSATTQWFINLSDNSANLDSQNGGFTVFGEVIGNGMDVVDAIQAVPTWDWSTIGPFDTIPLINYTAQDFVNGVQPDLTTVITVNEIVVIDANIDTAASLNPPLNTSANNPPPPPPVNGGGGGGGSIGLLSLLGLVALRRPRVNRRGVSDREGS